MVKCRVCGSSTSTKKFKKYNYDICICSSCHFVFTDLSPQKDFYDNFYSKDYYQHGSSKRGYDDYQNEEISIRQTFSQKVNELSLASTGYVLDIGCAYGYFLKEVPGRWQKFGLEVSSHSANLAAKLVPEAKIKNDFFRSNTFPGVKFDLITLFDVAEHLDNPKEVLKTVHHKLKPGGRVVLTTGDVDSLFSKIQGKSWHLYNPPQHLCYFSKSVMVKLLTEIGFKEIEVTYPWSTYSLSYLLYKLKSIYKFPLPIPKFAKHIYLKFNLWDIMTVTAVK